MLTNILKDLRVASRVLRRSPGFSLVSIVTIALAIGANAAIFSIVNGVILRPLPYPDAEELITFSLDASKVDVPELPLSPAGYWHFRDKNQVFEEMGGYVEGVQPLTGETTPEQVTVAQMTWSAFTTLRTSPVRGRTFSTDEDLPGGPQLALIGEDLWVSRYGSDPEMIGRTINLNGINREVIGILPTGFNFPSPDAQVWVPLQLDPATQNFGGHGIQPVARLKAGTSEAAALADIEALIGRLGEVGYGPQWFSGVLTGNGAVVGLRDSIVGESDRSILIVFGAVLLVFLIACANVANLFLVRTQTRIRETAVRSAMGATRAELIRFSLAESAVISVVSGILGLLLALLGTRALLALQPTAVPRLDQVGIDLAVLGFIALITLAASLFLGLLPAIRASRVPVSSALRDGGRSATVGRDSQFTRRVLVLGQVALAVLLLVGSGLMVRTAQALGKVDTGFQSDGILSFTLALPPATYPPGDGTAAFFGNLMETLRGMPGVMAAGAINSPPLSGQGPYLATAIEDQPVGPDDFPATFHIRRITPGYFETLGIPVLAGRAFNNTDHLNRTGSAIISSSIQESRWPDGTALGRRVAPSTASFLDIVGVVGDVRTSGLDEPFDEIIYLPMVDSIGGGVANMTVMVRSSGDPLSLVPGVRDEIGRLDPNLPITGIQLLEEAVSDSMADTNFTTFVLMIAALIALILGSVGIYGLISYIVGQRTVEIGIRMSFGANAPSIRTLFLKQGLILTAAGIVIGLATSALATRLLSTLIFGVDRFDTVTFVAAPLVFLLVALVASLLPANRAASVDPAIAFQRN